MSANFTMSSPSFPLGRSSAVLLVYRYNISEPDLVIGKRRKRYGRPKITGGNRYEFLPNIRCLSVTLDEGASPGSARFRYVFGDPLANPSNTPSRLEQVYPIQARGPKVVKTDDRIVVRQLSDDGTYTRIIFDGFVQLPQGDLEADVESATFEAMATPIREFDVPLDGATYRNGDDPTALKDADTDLPCRFNPDGNPNMVQDAYRSGSDPNKYAVFLDQTIIRTPDIRSYWTLARAVQYCQVQGNPQEDYTSKVAAATLDSLLVSVEPKVDGQPINLADNTTYQTNPIIVPDVDVTGDPWPVAIEKLVTPHGFSVRWDLSEKVTGTVNTDPAWQFQIYSKFDNKPVKSLYLQKAGGTYDPNGTNIGRLSLQRDRHHLFNQVVIDANPVRYEASFSLAMGFTPSSGDASISGRLAFDESSAAFSSNRDKYRLFVFDETGEGHWNGSSFVTTTTSLDDLFGNAQPATDGSNNTIPQYAVRRRKPIGTLFSKDSTGKRLKAELWLSTNYAGTVPGIWKQGSETWQKVSEGGWELLPDRLGIRLTMGKPWEWDIGKCTDSGAPFPSGKVNVIKSLANPDTANPTFTFRLTCVVESDQAINALATRQPGSPTQYTIERREDTRDRFVKHVISQYASTKVNDGDTNDVDDTARASDYADARRRAHENAVFAGTVTIPRITKAYAIGDHIDNIVGRNLSLQVNAGTEQGAGPTYPVVSSLTWNFDGQQSTTLYLTDRRAEPPRRRTT